MQWTVQNFFKFPKRFGGNDDRSGIKSFSQSEIGNRVLKKGGADANVGVEYKNR